MQQQQMQAILSKVEAIKAFLNSKFMEREEIIEAAWVALVAKQHMFVVGPPGVAKSNIFIDLMKCITDAKHFKKVLTPRTTLEDLVGMYNLPLLSKGEFERLTAGMLPEADLVFIDEIWKAELLTVELLEMFNERTYKNGSKDIELPLLSAFAASNEFPKDTITTAIYDRLLLRFEVSYIEEDQNFKRMLMNDMTGIALPTITLDELKWMQDEAAKIPLTDEVAEQLTNLRHDLKDSDNGGPGLMYSERRWNQMVTLLKAKAILNNRQEIYYDEDFEILLHSLWDEPQQKAQVQPLIDKICGGNARLSEILDEARDAALPAIGAGNRNEPNSEDKGLEAIRKLKTLTKELKAIKSGITKPLQLQKADKALKEIDKLLQEVAEACMGVRVA